jgi:hypothetical protein
VRDAAVELIGKYMIESPEVVGDYYTKIADRIAVRVFHRLEAHLADSFRIRDLEFGNV